MQGKISVRKTIASADSSQEVASSIEELSAGMLEVMSTTHILNNILRFQRNQTN